MNHPRMLVVGFALGSAGCVQAPQKAPVQVTQAPAPAMSEAPASASPAPEPLALPTTCEPQGPRKTCTPDPEFAKRLCASDRPDLALTLFSKAAPFSRAYLTRDVDGWNASGGRSRPSKVLFDEEVLVVAYRKANPNGIVLVTANGDSGSYDVLRWDGSCVSVSADEISLSRPPQPKRAPLLWKRLEEPTKAALLNEPKIKASYEAYKSCEDGAEAKCAKAESSFQASIVEFVRAGGNLPVPTNRP